MRAVVIRSHGGPDVLELTDIAQPHPGPGEVLVRVRAVSVNSFLDVSNRAGHVPFARYDFLHVLGSERAGEVAGVGPGADTAFAFGDAVLVSNTVPCRACDACAAGSDEQCGQLGIIGVNRPGAYAEYAAVPAHLLRPIPPGVSFEGASALGVNGPLAVAQLLAVGAAAGQTVLVQAAGSSSGSMALLVARAMGLSTIGTTRSSERATVLRDLGVADHIVVSNEPDALDQIRSLTAGRGVDIVLDNLGAPDAWTLSVGSLAVGGAAVTSGAKFGGRVEVDLRSLYTLSRRIVGVRTLNNAAKNRLRQLVADNGLRPLIDSVLPLEAAADAHRRIEAGQNLGRAILSASS